MATMTFLDDGQVELTVTVPRMQALMLEQRALAKNRSVDEETARLLEADDLMAPMFGLPSTLTAPGWETSARPSTPP